MKDVKLFTSVTLVGILFALAGCNSQTVKSNVALTDHGFPEVMVGIWQVERTPISKWAFKFEPDGSISKLIHFLAGPINVAEGGVFKEGTPETYYLFELEKCTTEYSPKSQMINLQVFVDHFEMKVPSGLLEGRIEDYLSGPVSEDGKTWHVKWVNLGWLEGGAPPPKDILFENPTPLVFKKLELEASEGDESP